MHFTHKFAAILLLSLLAVSCKKKEEQVVPVVPGGSTARTESFSMTVNGTSCFGAYDTKIFNEAQQYLQLNGTCGTDVILEFIASGDLSTGSHQITTGNFDYSFLIVYASNTSYFCTDCTVDVEVHDIVDRYFKCRITGTLTDPITSATQTLTEAKVSVFY